jgi:hypothetical protein
LEAGKDIKAQGENALLVAVGNGNGMTDIIVPDDDAHVNSRGGNHGSALQATAYYGDWDNINILLERGADAAGNRGQCVALLLKPQSCDAL